MQIPKEFQEKIDRILANPFAISLPIGFSNNFPEAYTKIHNHLVNPNYKDGNHPNNLRNLHAREDDNRTRFCPQPLIAKLRPRKRIRIWLENEPWSKYMEGYLRCLETAASANTYLSHFIEYLEFSSLTSIQFAEMDPKVRHDSMVKWLIHLADRNLKKSSKKTMLAALVKYLQVNLQEYYPKGLLPFVTNNGCNQIGGWVAYDDDDIRTMLAYATVLRTIALIHFFKDTAARPNAVCDPVLRMKHLAKMYDGCYAIHLYDDSSTGQSETSSTAVWVFLTEESTLALNAYFDSRRLAGEIFTNESPIFASTSETHDHLTLYDVYRIFKELHEKAKIKKIKIDNNPRGRNDKSIIYGFRKRFQNLLVNNGTIHERVIDKLYGHKGQLHDRYYRPTKEDLYREFKKIAPKLMVTPEAKMKIQIESQDKELEELRQTAQIKNDLEKKCEKLERALVDKVLERVDNIPLNDGHNCVS